MVYDPMGCPEFSADNLFSNCFIWSTLKSLTSTLRSVRPDLSAVGSTHTHTHTPSKSHTNTLEVLIDRAELLFMA